MDATGQGLEDTEGRASAFRRALDAQAEVAYPGQALVPRGPHDQTAPIDRAQILEALADPQAAHPEEAESAEGGAADARTRVPPWSPEIKWVDGTRAPVDSSETVLTAPSSAIAPLGNPPSKPTQTKGARTVPTPGPGRIWIVLVASTVLAAAATVVVFIQINGGSTGFPSALTTEPQMPGGGAVPAASATSGEGSGSQKAKASRSALPSSKPTSSANPHGSASARAKQTSNAAVSATASSSSAAVRTATAGTSPTAKGAADSALSNTQTGQCLDTPGSAYSSGAVEQVAACGASAFQTWTLTSGQLTQDGGSYCLDDYNWDSTPGSEVDLWPCNGGSNQQWTLESDGSIVGVHSDLCVTATGQGNAVDLESCDGSAAQKWSWG